MPQARRDIARLAAFMSSGSPAAGRKARATIWSAIRSLDQFPERGRSAPAPSDGLRELYVRFGRGAYVIEYFTDRDQVIVLRIFHSLEER
ncbi:MAG: type II toxin-antitoxin system RelE/ParE family toxin [Brevundimonas sp.]|nr:type II toxin-antitoxin system RelE/ParE family toxin [Brevundimonas sp.]